MCWLSFESKRKTRLNITPDVTGKIVQKLYLARELRSVAKGTCRVPTVNRGWLRLFRALPLARSMISFEVRKWAVNQNFISRGIAARLD